MLGEQDDRQLGALGAQLEHGAQAVVGVVGRHPDVGDDEIGTMAADAANQLRAIAGDPGDRDAGAFEHELQSLPHQHLVLADHDPHGITASTLVPPPARLSKANSPPTRCDPVGHAADAAAGTRSPGTVVGRPRPAADRRCDRARPAATSDSACLTALTIASETTK